MEKGIEHKKGQNELLCYALCSCCEPVRSVRSSGHFYIEDFVYNFIITRTWIIYLAFFPTHGSISCPRMLICRAFIGSLFLWIIDRAVWGRSLGYWSLTTSQPKHCCLSVWLLSDCSQRRRSLWNSGQGSGVGLTVTSRMVFCTVTHRECIFCWWVWLGALTG